MYSHKGRRNFFLLTSLLTVVSLILIVQVVTMLASLSSNKGRCVLVRKISSSLARSCWWQTGAAGSFRLHLLQHSRLLQQKRCHHRRRRCLHCEMLRSKGSSLRDHRDVSRLEGHGLVQVVCQYTQSSKYWNILSGSWGLQAPKFQILQLERRLAAPTAPPGSLEGTLTIHPTTTRRWWGPSTSRPTEMCRPTPPTPWLWTVETSMSTTSRIQGFATQSIAENKI